MSTLTVMEPNPYVIAACALLILLSWLVVSTVLALAIGRVVAIADRRRNRPRYRRAAR